MERQGTSGVLARAGRGLALGSLLMASGPAWATSHVQSIPGASCRADGPSTATWDYRGTRLLNTGTGPYEAVIAVCPISLWVPGAEPQEYRVILKDPQRRETWCQVYASTGSLWRTQYASDTTTLTMSGSLGTPLGSTSGMVEATFHCLLLNGASLEEVEIVWWKP